MEWDKVTVSVLHFLTVVYTPLRGRRLNPGGSSDYVSIFAFFFWVA